MKTYKNLWDEFISDENIKLAIQNSSKGKRNRAAVQKYYPVTEESISKVKRYVEHFHNHYHKPIIINDGINRKQRTIIVPKYDEQIVHHMVINVLKPIITKGSYFHSYASIPNKGTHKGRGKNGKRAKEFIETWLKNDRKNTKYCLKMDIRKFFDTIPIDKMKTFISGKIRDDKFLHILFEILDVKPLGLPLGFYTSQWLSNWYLEPLDRYIKEELRAKYYVRYMDDMVIFGSNKRNLHKIKNMISNFLSENLGLEMKNNWQVFRMHYVNEENEFGRFLDFLGFRFYRNRTTLRRSIMLKATRKSKRMSKKLKMTIHEIRQFVSYIGYINATNTYNMYIKYIKPYVSFQYCKRRISNYTMNKNRKEKNHGMVLC